MWKSPIWASSAAMAKSQEIISSKPPAVTKPSRTAIEGVFIEYRRSQTLADSTATSIAIVEPM